jgi:signal transduction histidine kinase
VTLRGAPLTGYGARITDDGPGFTPRGDGRSPLGHMGLSSMQERAEALGGWTRVDTSSERGTTVEAWLPQKQMIEAELPAA